MESTHRKLRRFYIIGDGVLILATFAFHPTKISRAYERFARASNVDDKVGEEASVCYRIAVAPFVIFEGP